MKTAIIYISKHGTTEKIVRKLSKKIKGDVDLINLRETPNPDFSKYDKIILGGSIYMGSISKRLKAFMRKKIESIYDKKIGLFLVCMYEGEVARKQFEENFPEPLRKKSMTNGFFGGELIISKLNPLEKIVVWVVKKNNKSLSHIHEEEIEKFAKQFNQK